MRNEPNSTRPTAKSQQPKNAKRTQSHNANRTKNAKRTQFPQVSDHPKAPLCETNPISVETPIYILQSTIYNPLAQFPPRDFTKRTQFAPPPPSHRPKNAKRTQSRTNSPLLHYSPSPLLPFSTTPLLLHYSTTPLLHFSTSAPTIPRLSKTNPILTNPNGR